MLANNNLIDESQTDISVSDQQETAGVIAEIRSAVIDGNTWYYLRLSGSDVYYAISAAADQNVVILNAGDDVSVKYAAGEGKRILRNAFCWLSGNHSLLEKEELECINC